ncbi:glycosyltransferase family 4 protein [Holdemanella sp.]|uniref:glycosyltransferase family 4 protein n=1 Tax=Holdemanella sp. TaxID=1971762 RepID=UPI003AF058FA
MKILHIHPSMAGGGIEAMICGLVNEMAKVHDVTLCTIFEPKKEDVFEKKLSSSVHRISLGKKIPGFSIKEVFDIYRCIRDGHYDVVHIHGFFYYYSLAVYLLHKRVKFVYTIHSDAAKENTIWDKRFIRIKKYAFQKDYIHPVTISKESKWSFAAYYGLDSTLIYNGIPDYIAQNNVSKLIEYRKTDKTKLFLHPGRISEPKNQVVLVKAFDRLIKEGNDVVLLIAGSKQDLQIWSEIEPYLTERIVYLGERSDVRDLLAESDAFCLPSIWEGMPVTLLEALSVGCIPICSPVGGIPEVITNGENGFLSSDSSEEAYYKALKSFVSCTDVEIKDIKQKCLKTFDKFRISEVVKKYIEVYKSII